MEKYHAFENWLKAKNYVSWNTYLSFIRQIQSLKPEIGREHLKKQIIEVTTLMSIAKSKEQFQSLFKQKYCKEIQLELEFNEIFSEEKPLPMSILDLTLRGLLSVPPPKKGK